MSCELFLQDIVGRSRTLRYRHRRHGLHLHQDAPGRLWRQRHASSPPMRSRRNPPTTLLEGFSAEIEHRSPRPPDGRRDRLHERRLPFSAAIRARGTGAAFDQPAHLPASRMYRIRSSIVPTMIAVRGALRQTFAGGSTDPRSVLLAGSFDGARRPRCNRSLTRSPWDPAPHRLPR